MSTSDKMSPPDEEFIPSQAVIKAIAAEEGVDVTDVEPPTYAPLFTVINPEALDRLFATTTETDSDAVVFFEYMSYEVTVRPGDVDVCERSATDSHADPIEE